MNIMCPETRHALTIGNALTPYGVRVYTTGDCWLLAWCLHKQFGFPLFTLGSRYTWRHVVVQVGVDAFLDANGISTGLELDARWGQEPFSLSSHNAMDYDTYVAHLGANIEYGAGIYEASLVADVLVRKYVDFANASRIIAA